MILLFCWKVLTSALAILATAAVVAAAVSTVMVAVVEAATVAAVALVSAVADLAAFFVVKDSSPGSRALFTGMNGFIVADVETK